MSLSEEEILRHLRDDIAGRPLSFGEIDAVFNPYDHQPDLIHGNLLDYIDALFLLPCNVFSPAILVRSSADEWQLGYILLQH